MAQLFSFVSHISGAMSWTVVWLCLYLYLCVCVRPSHASPPQHRGWLRLWEEGEACGECQGHLCPPAPPNCPAGLVRDNCDCCEQCANAEGQLCDPDGAQEFYGHCGEGLHCRRPPRRKRRLKGGDGDDSPEPKCVCRSTSSVCGSDGRTYPNPCQLREEASRLGKELRVIGAGPCHSAPQISRAPQDLTNYTGNDIAFGCEVSAFPIPSVSWKKNGSDNILPGDDPHISVQARGGPQRFTISTWLQIQGLRLSDAGSYSCISQNALGNASALARLQVLRKVSQR
ncbi:kazal-type serine protease inhibitor domain-containing protein 1-like isoform X1 [Alosa sapidissima]|uniref:kazal-type serine protease inhibitor domain-containing protein 1-like isoform X1 n=2 Tax=Alosa sapidissima TaxID=34773 RepID=UPI001C0A4E8B|nr:kazal-type serine protease inhibitor domain-containing protein 1-like isoform X1 [Alosa sapidissima]